MTPQTLATLLNLEILIPYEEGRYVLVEQRYLTSLFGHTLSQVPVDEAWYKSRYPDIAPALSRGILKTAKEHYVRFGFFEHRFPYFIKVDEEWYLQNYPDVREAVNRDDFKDAQYHFEEFGFREGRLPFSGFNLALGKVVE